MCPVLSVVDIPCPIVFGLDSEDQFQPELEAARVEGGLEGEGFAAFPVAIAAAGQPDGARVVVGFDELALSDTLVNELSQTQGISVLPVNRTVAAMRALGAPQIGTPQEALALARTLGVDAVIVGTITAYDPYDPPVLGLSLALYAPSGSLAVGDAEMLDTRRLTYQPTDYDYFASMGVMADRPVSSLAEHLDARNHGVLMDLRMYAEGRSDRESALGWRVYTRSMDRYTEFAVWHAVSGLMDREWIRVGGERVATGN